jgi:prepilin-type N-terminal cleavage/methylation domain-containing protein/prepilin-type processing-associated H-X9-DG protein
MPRRGFTLVEVLIVVAVVAIIAAVLFPIIASAKENRRAATCLSNMAQIHKSALIYAGNNDDGLPEAERFEALGLTKRKRTSSGSDHPRAILICPNYMALGTEGVSMEGGYALNGCLQRAQADRPSSVVLVAEAAEYRTMLPGNTFDPLASRTGDALMAPDRIMAKSRETFDGLRIVGPIGPWGTERHSGRSHYAFVDGHVRTLGAETFYIPSLTDLCGTSNAKYDVSTAEGKPRFATQPFTDPRGSFSH